MKPFNSKHIREAQEAGLRLVSRDPKLPNSMVYECPQCGQHILIRVETVRKLANGKTKKLYDCPHCKQSDYTEQAMQNGLEIIGEDNNSHYLTYKFRACGHVQRLQKQAVKKSEFKCQTCYDERLEREANRRNLTIIGKGRERNYRLYENTDCHHRYELTTSHVRLAGEISDEPYPCNICIYEQQILDAKATGLILYGKSSRIGAKNKSYLYHAECGHSLERRADQIRLGDWKCRACIDTKLSGEAETAGVSLIGKGRDKAFRTYEFKNCGHVKEITTASIRNGTFHCEICFWDGVDDVLTKRGLKVIDKGAKIGSRLFMLIGCGHIQDIDLQSAKGGTFVCHECNDTSYTLPSNVYLLRIYTPEFEWLKLGYAKVVETRIRQYGLSRDAITEPLAILPRASGEEAVKTEKMIEAKYKANKLDPKLMKKWHTIGGFTECYPMELRQKLESEIAVLAACDRGLESV